MSYLVDKEHQAKRAEQQEQEAERLERWRKEAQAVCGDSE